MRIVHFSDNHLGKIQFGLPERERDIYEGMERAVNLALKLKPDLILHTGDLFDHHVPHPRAFVRAVTYVTKLLEAGIPVVMIEGNHDVGPDTLRGRTSSAVQNLKNLLDQVGLGKDFHVLRPGRKLDFGDIVIAGLPYTPRAVDVAGAIKSLDKVNSPGKLGVLMIHQGVKELIATFYPEIELSALLSTRFRLFAMGHYHRKVVRRKGERILAYPGSTEVIDVREAVEPTKYLLVYEVNGKDIEVEEMRIKTRPFIRLSRRVNKIKDLNSLVEELSQIASKHEKKPVLIIRVSTEELPPHKIREALNQVRDGFLYIRDSIRARVREEEVEISPRGFDLAELITSIIREMPLEERVKEMSIKAFRTWYLEGKRGPDFVKAVKAMWEDLYEGKEAGA